MNRTYETATEVSKMSKIATLFDRLETLENLARELRDASAAVEDHFFGLIPASVSESKDPPPPSGIMNKINASLDRVFTSLELARNCTSHLIRETD